MADADAFPETLHPCFHFLLANTPILQAPVPAPALHFRLAKHQLSSCTQQLLFRIFRSRAKLGFVFNVALAMRNFTMTADTPAEAQATPCLQKALVETKLVSWVENYMWHLPRWRHILKYVAHEHLGVLVCFLLLHKSHTTFFPHDLGQEKKLQNSNWHTIVPDIQEKFALTAGWWGGSLQTFLSSLNIFRRMSEKSLLREVAGLTNRAGADTLLELQDLNSLWLISRGKVSNVFRQNCLLLLQDLSAPCCSIFGLFSRAANAPHGLSVGQDLSALAKPRVSREEWVWLSPVFAAWTRVRKIMSKFKKKKK